MPPTTTFIGIDPGVYGACVAIRGDQLTMLKNEISTEADQWRWIAQFINEPAYALIEQQTARPTWIPDKDSDSGFRQTVLASTVMLYGSYRDLRTMLLCADIDGEDVPPKRWQNGLAIPPKFKGESDNSWKNKLKTEAIRLFPAVKVTLWNADALLIAYYCRQVFNERAQGTTSRSVSRS